MYTSQPSQDFIVTQRIFLVIASFLLIVCFCLLGLQLPLRLVQYRDSSEWDRVIIEENINEEISYSLVHILGGRRQVFF